LIDSVTDARTQTAERVQRNININGSCVRRGDSKDAFTLRSVLQAKKSRALNETPSQRYAMSLAIWDQYHTVLPVTLHK